jgi:hypothetical protein
MKQPATIQLMSMQSSMLLNPIQLALSAVSQCIRSLAEAGIGGLRVRHACYGKSGTAGTRALVSRSEAQTTASMMCASTLMLSQVRRAQNLPLFNLGTVSVAAILSTVVRTPGTFAVLPLFNVLFAFQNHIHQQTTK